MWNGGERREGLGSFPEAPSAGRSCCIPGMGQHPGAAGIAWPKASIMCHSFHPLLLHGLVDLEWKPWRIRDSSREAPGQGAGVWGKPARHSHGCFQGIKQGMMALQACLEVEELPAGPAGILFWMTGDLFLSAVTGGRVQRAGNGPGAVRGMME